MADLPHKDIHRHSRTTAALRLHSSTEDTTTTDSLLLRRSNTDTTRDHHHSNTETMEAHPRNSLRSSLHGQA